MNIALCTDENFSIPALVCITSILENNVEEECNIYILTDNLSVKAREKFDRLALLYHQTIRIIDIDKHCFDGLVVSERYPMSMYYRFLVPEMLPEEKIALYLDCDIIVRHSLRKLFCIDISEYAIGAVVSQSCDWVNWSNELKLTSTFFNSGVMLMNLEYWRNNDICTLLVKWIDEKNTDMWLPDQYALNKILDGKVFYLDYRYNFQERWTHPLTGSYMHFRRWEEICKAGEDPVVMHYCDAEKPWFIESSHKFKDEFLKYATKHEFIGFRPIQRYGVAYKCSVLLDKIGLKLHYWAEEWQRWLIKQIRVS